MKLLNWLNDQDSPEILEPTEKDLSPALRQRLDELAHIEVSRVMVPRPLITALDADVQLRRVKRLKSSKVRYFPVYKGDLDHILGWVEKSKVLELLSEGQEDAQLAKHLQPLARVPEKAMVSHLADIFLRAKSPIAVVANEQGQTVGLITLRDFVQLLFGFDIEEVTAAVAAESPAPKPYEI